MGDIRVDLKGLEEFRDKIQKAADEAGRQAFMESCAKELAARLLTKVIKRTPVGDYSDTYDLEDDGQQKFLVMSDKQGGTLRRSWTAGAIEKAGDTYTIKVTNDQLYASYVEFGHRQTPGRYVPAIGKRLKASWVEGQHMLTISEKEIREAAPGILEKKLNQWLKRVFE